MRLFVAVDVPQSIKDAIEQQVVDPLRDAVPGARWTRPEGRHLTLKFLGETADDRVASVVEALASVRHPSFDASFDELGAFPSLRRPRVLWTGIGPGRDALVEVAAVVEDALAPLGFPTEDRAFHPHLTLARFPKPRIIELVPQVDIPADGFLVNEVVLFRSQLHPKGARYTALERFALS